MENYWRTLGPVVCVWGGGGGGGGGGALTWSVVYRCVNKKMMRKGTFFELGQCAALSSFRVGTMLFLGEKRVCFHKLNTKVAEIREYLDVFYYIGKGYFWWTQPKRGIDFKMSNTLPRVSFAVLCSRIGTTVDQHPPPPPPETRGESKKKQKKQTNKTKQNKTKKNTKKNNSLSISGTFIYRNEMNYRILCFTWEIGILLVGGTSFKAASQLQIRFLQPGCQNKHEYKTFIQWK